MIKDFSPYSMQISVPHSEYGPCSYFMPKLMDDWLKKYSLQGSYCGSNSWGDGYTNGVTNKESSYIVHNVELEDSIAFQIMFPKCRLHVSKEYA